MDKLDTLVIGGDLLHVHTSGQQTAQDLNEGGVRTALRSLSTSRMFLHPELPGYCAGLSIMYSYRLFLLNTPPSTSLKLTISAPSSKILTDVGGIEPGKMPPMSA